MSEECICEVCIRLGQPSHNQALGRSCQSQSLQIDHLRPSFHHFSPRLAHGDETMLSQETLRYLETDSNPHTLTVAQQFQSRMTQPNASMEMNEMKARLGKDEVDILERAFKRYPKPTTMTKRQFAEDMGVDLSRINNWFQNRRAKRKQEKKQEAYEAGQAQEALGQYSEPSSPDFNYANTTFHVPTAAFGFHSGLPPPVALYNPQYCDPSTASMVSLHRTLAAAQATSEHNGCHNFVDRDSLNSFRRGSLVYDSANNDPVRSHSPDDSIVHFNGPQYSHPSASGNNLHTGDQNLASSSETPQAQMNMQPSSENWPTMELSESKNQLHFDTPDDPRYILMGLHVPQPSYLRATNPPKTFVFSHTTTDDFLDECEPHRYNTKSASEDRDEQPHPTETGLSPVLAVFDEGRSANDATKVEKVKIKVEIDCQPKFSHQDEDVSEDKSCTSDKPELFGSSYMKTCNAILSSTLDRQENKQGGLILPILDPMRQALVERAMDEFYLIFNQEWAARIIQCPGGCSSTSGDGKDRGTVVDKVSLSTSQQKRQRSHNEDSADESDDKKPRRQRGGPGLPSELNKPARFACPFRKHNPQKYSLHNYRVCALTSWDTIARVKEHLYRNHKGAPYCKRCWKVFETEEVLDSHATVPAASICEAQPGHPPEGITPKQVAELRSKAKPYSKQNETERWKEIFRLLFPSESVPSPYWEQVQDHVPASPNSQVLVHYDDYMNRELPRLFRSKVEEVVRREVQHVEASLLANLEGLIRECQDQLSSGYRETHITEQQSEIPPTQATETLADPVNLIKTAEHLRIVAVETDQQPSSDFFDAVLHRLPPQEEEYVLDFSASDAELFGPYKHASSGNLSDSGYASVPRCSCKELCRCLTSMTGFENQDVVISEPSFADPTQNLETQAHGVQWQYWLENRD